MTLVSFWHNFVFVSNTKAASSTIHHLAFPKSDLVFYRPGFGKHFEIPQISAMTQRIAKRKFSDMFSFGVVREPASWMQSWFRFRKRAGLAAPSHADHANYIPPDLTFPEFIEEAAGAAPRPFAKIPPQSRYFRNAAGEIQVKFVATYENLSKDALAISAYEPLSAVLNVDRLVINSTSVPADKSAGSQTVNSDVSARLRTFLAPDFDLYERAARGELRQVLPYKNFAAPSVVLTPKERAENIVSRLTLHHSLGQYAEAAAWLPLLDPWDEAGIKPMVTRIKARAGWLSE